MEDTRTISTARWRIWSEVTSYDSITHTVLSVIAYFKIYYLFSSIQKLFLICRISTFGAFGDFDPVQNLAVTDETPESTFLVQVA